MARISWPRLKPILIQALGYFFLVLGVLGMFLPILQGFLFLFVGLIILARHAPWAQRLLDRIRNQHPKFDQMISTAERKSHEWGERVKAKARAWGLMGGGRAPVPSPAPCRPADRSARRDVCDNGR